LIKTTKSFFEKYFILFFIGILAIAGFNYFYHLDAERVWDWDEARAGVTAYEMIQNHNFVVSTFAHQNDLWNLKPPLGAWFIVLDYKLFGFNVFALRFYSGFCCFLSLLAVAWIMVRTVGKIPALISCFILTTTSSMIFSHGARSGDYSPLFTLLVLFFIICLLLSKTKPFYLYLAGIVFSISFLVYSFAAFQLFVLAIIYWLITKDYKKIRFKNYLIFILCAFIPILAWAVWRLCNVDGWAFLRGMVSYDLIKRATQPLEGHVGNFDSYIVDLAKYDCFWFVFMVMILISFFCVIGINLKFNNRLLTLSTLGLLVPYVLFSLAKTKLGWYVIPAYPSFAITAGCLTGILLNDSRCRTAGKVFILIIFLIAGIRAEREIQKTIDAPVQETAQSILNDFKKTNYVPNSAIYRKGWTQSNYFVSEVVCGLNPVDVNDLKECLNHPGYLMLEKDKVSTDSQDFVKFHRLNVILQNEDWMIVKL